MATSVFITGLAGDQSSAQEILGATAVNRGFRVRALSVDGIPVAATGGAFGDFSGTLRQLEVAVVPGHIYEVDVDDSWVRQRLARQHGSMGVSRANWIEVPGAAAAVSATATLTSDNTNPAVGDTVTINNVTYRFESTLAQANDVKIGANADATLTSLGKAVNQNGVAGTDYFAGTVAPTGVSAGTENATNHTIVFTATTPGTGGNSFASTETSAHLSFGGATFSGGSNSSNSNLSVLTVVPIRSLLTESSAGIAQSFISRGLPIQQQEILYPDYSGGPGGQGVETEVDIKTLDSNSTAPTVDLTNPAMRRALRMHPGRWTVGAPSSTLITIRGLMTSNSAPSSSGGYGLSSGRGFRIPKFEAFTTSGENSNLGYINSTTNTQVDLADPNVRRALRRNTGRWIVVSAP